ncbi:MAG TPA: hypothetical protein VGB14_10130 [Acidimicrobiales bacterium]
MTTSRRLAALVLAGLVAAACGVRGDAGGGAGDAAATVAGMLGRLPAVEGAGGYVVVNLHAVAREAAGLAVPDPADGEAVGDYRRAIVADREPGAGVFLAPAAVTGALARTPAEWDAELGFDLLDVDADATAGLPPGQVEVVVGDVDRSDVGAAVGSDPVWSDVLQEVDHGGATYWSWGEEGAADVSRISATREVGESRRLFVEGGALAWTRTDAAVEATIDAWHGDAAALADDADLAALAAALDAEGCHAAFLSTDDAAYAAGAGPALPRYDALATGVRRDGGGTSLVVAFRYPDAAGAEAGAEALRRVVAEGRSLVTDQPWSAVLRGAEVQAEGRVVVGVFPTDRGELWHQVPLTRDTLLAWA